ncbi:hypothetical protein BBP40_001237 [Aspergillus hancockii]|nr:hypothetical protein BBP40_001237 [Aspergillus hancockii]
MQIDMHLTITVKNLVAPVRSALLKAWCFWPEYLDDLGNCSLWRLSYSNWLKVLSSQCGYDEDFHLVRYSFRRDSDTVTGYVFCKMQWLSAIELMLEAEGRIQFEIVSKLARLNVNEWGNRWGVRDTGGAELVAGDAEGLDWDVHSTVYTSETPLAPASSGWIDACSDLRIDCVRLLFP